MRRDRRLARIVGSCAGVGDTALLGHGMEFPGVGQMGAGIGLHDATTGGHQILRALDLLGGSLQLLIEDTELPLLVRGGGPNCIELDIQIGVDVGEFGVGAQGVCLGIGTRAGERLGGAAYRVVEGIPVRPGAILTGLPLQLRCFGDLFFDLGDQIGDIATSHRDVLIGVFHTLEHAVGGGHGMFRLADGFNQTTLLPGWFCLQFACGGEHLL